MPNHFRILRLCLTGSLALACAGAASRAAAQGPSSGFTMDARLSTLNMPGFVDPSNGVGGPPALTLGYRTPRFSVSFGPAINRVELKPTPCEAALDPSACAGSAVVTQSHVTLIGGHFGASFILAALDGDHLELYALLGASLARVIRSGDLNDSVAFGLLGGFGVRYFLARSFALGAEIGEGYGVVPLATGAGRTHALSTWGAITLQIVFGG